VAMVMTFCRASSLPELEAEPLLRLLHGPSSRPTHRGLERVAHGLFPCIRLAQKLDTRVAVILRR
jgi:hypothetical protein